ncbi:CCA tRNA nucleotidyltransferase [Candidatus Woesearchaeota archaeon]|nr:CCA tRNA nucleotidyltransferase [Candidatus Woesearchaeota archaeon]
MFEAILKKIKPSVEDEKKIFSLTNDLISKIKIKDTKVIIGGSLAKNTWLKDTHDIDIFVKFNYDKFKDKSHKLSIFLEKALKKFKPIKLHGSRDYFQIEKQNYNFEIVPILDIKNIQQARNITDISPLHVSWVKKHCNKRKMIRNVVSYDDIRLTKAFAKAQNVYGAESYIQGFSGYVLEILTIHYGSFLNLIKSASKWKEKTIIDPEKQLKNPLIELNKSKIHSPLILVDPVDKTRNASAVLSKEKYDLFIKASKEFLKNKSERFFVKKEEKIPKNSIIIKISPPKGKKDVIGSKLNSLFNKIKKQLSLHGFVIKKAGWIWKEKACFWFNLKSNKLTAKMLVKGPPLDKKEHVIKFKKKHKNAFVKNNIIYAKEKRRFSKARDLIKDTIKKHL